MKGVLALSLILLSANGAIAQQSVPVTVDNFVRAETDMYMGRTIKDGGLGEFVHSRTPREIDKQTVVRMNRDTLYSQAVFDLDAGPVSITLPEAGKRVMSMQVVNVDNYCPMVIYEGANGNSISAAQCLQDLEARLLQHIRDIHSQERFIFDDEDNDWIWNDLLIINAV